jgi:hypothetical protein
VNLRQSCGSCQWWLIPGSEAGAGLGHGRADSNRDSNATTLRTDAAYDDTLDRAVLAHRPAPWPELIRKRSVVQVHVAPPLTLQVTGIPITSH